MYRIADCSQYIELDFGSYGVFEPKSASKNKIKATISEIKARRKKMVGFRKAVDEFADRFDIEMAAAEAALAEYL
jgi:hypothetical protein